jgi:hypothetical protein
MTTLASPVQLDRGQPHDAALADSGAVAAGRSPAVSRALVLHDDYPPFRLTA